MLPAVTTRRCCVLTAVAHWNNIILHLDIETQISKGSNLAPDSHMNLTSPYDSCHIVTYKPLHLILIWTRLLYVTHVMLLHLNPSTWFSYEPDFSIRLMSYCYIYTPPPDSHMNQTFLHDSCHIVTYIPFHQTSHDSCHIVTYISLQPTLIWIRLFPMTHAILLHTYIHADGIDKGDVVPVWYPTET